MQSFEKQLLKIHRNKPKKFNMFLFLKENWKGVFTTLVIIAGFSLLMYLNHFNRLDLFIDLIRDNKSDLIVIILPLLFLSFVSLCLLTSAGWGSVIILNEIKVDNAVNLYHKSFLLIPILSSILINILFYIGSYCIDNQFIKDNLLAFCFFSSLIFNIAIYWLILKLTKIAQQLSFSVKIRYFLSLSIVPIVVFNLTTGLFLSRFIAGKLTIKSLTMVSGLLLSFAIISLIPLICYFYEIRFKTRVNKVIDLLQIIKRSFYLSITLLLLVFIVTNKTFIFTTYQALKILGISDFTTVNEFSITRNDDAILKLTNNKWSFSYEFNGKIVLNGRIGFHLGDIYLICKETSGVLFDDSLRYNLDQATTMPFDSNTCIAFNKNEIDIIQVDIK